MPGILDGGADPTTWTEFSAFADVAGGIVTGISVIATQRPVGEPGEVEDFFCLNFASGVTCGAGTGFGQNLLTTDYFASGPVDASVIASNSVTITAADTTPPVPLPASLGFLALGLAGLGVARARRKG